MLAIDHLVIAASDPGQAAKDFEEKYDLKPIKGGKHENWGTYNFLAFLANDCYIEWIGVFDEERAQQSKNPLIQRLVRVLQHRDEELFQIAFRTEKMDQIVEQFSDNQIPYQGPIKGSRKNPNESTLAWRMLFPHHAVEDHDLYPFLIEWGKMKNLPNDPQYMNKQRLQSVTVCKQLKEKLTTVYGLRIQEDKVLLNNAIIQFSKEEKLQFKLTK